MEKIKSHKRIFVGIFLVIILIAIVATVTIKKRGQYTFVPPRQGEVVEAIYGLGKVKTHHKYEIKLGVMTNVQKVFVQEGELVQKGEPLIQFTDSPIFRAPFTGTVTRIEAEAPETVFPQTTILTLEDLDDKYIEVSLEQKDVLKVKKGQKAHVLFESIRGHTLEGTVESVFPKSDEFLVHINVTNLQKNILPGMTADVTIDVARHQNALLIPISGLSNGNVIIKRDGKQIKVPVEIGSVDGQWAQVIEGDIRMTDEILMSVKKDS